MITRKDLRDYATVAAVLSAIGLSITVVAWLREPRLNDYPTIETVAELFTHGEVTLPRPTRSGHTHFWDARIYTRQGRYYVRGNSVEELRDRIQFIQEDEPVLIYYDPFNHQIFGYRAVQVESARGVLYSFARERGRRHTNFVWATFGLSVSLFIAVLIHFILTPRNK